MMTKRRRTHWPVELNDHGIATRCHCDWRPPHQDQELLFKHMLAWVPAVQEGLRFTPPTSDWPTRRANFPGHAMRYARSRMIPMTMVLACSCGWTRPRVTEGMKRQLSDEHVMETLAARCGMQYSSETNDWVRQEMD